MEIPANVLLTCKSVSLSLMLHVLLGLLLIASFDATPEVPQPKKETNIVKAVAVDKKQVEDELNKIKIFEEEKRRKEEQRLQQIAKQAKKLAEDRKAEEKRLAEVRRKKQQQQQQAAELAKKAKELERKRALEEKKIKEAEQKNARLKAEEEARQKRLAEQKAKEEALEKQKLREQELVAALQAEEEAHEKKLAEQKTEEETLEKQKLREQELVAALQAEEISRQQRQDQKLIDRIKRDIIQSIVNNFNVAGLPDNLECKLLIRLIPGGEVIDVSITKSSNNDVFDSRAINATQKASPLPIPPDLATFERLDLREINMTFRPIR